MYIFISIIPYICICYSHQAEDRETTPVKKFPQENYNGEVLSIVIADARNRVWHLKKKMRTASVVSLNCLLSLIMNYIIAIVIIVEYKDLRLL